MGTKMLNGLETFSSDNNSENKLTEAGRAELYTRIYKWAAEDFTAVSDMKVFIEDLLKWARSVETRLSKLGYNMSSHTHAVMPHWHVGAGPQIGGMSTLIPKSPTQLRWPKGTMFKMIKNTTGARSNITQNKISSARFPTIGDSEYGRTGRMLKIPILSNPTLNAVIMKTK